MKRAIILVLVVGLLAGLVHMGLSLQSSSAAPPQQPPGQGAPVQVPTLLTIAEDVTLNPGDTFRSGLLDVQSFRLFKLYARLTPYVSEEQPPVRIYLSESPFGAAVNEHFVNINPDYWWHWRGSPRTRWATALSFDGLYSSIGANAKNNGTENVTISLYLLMAED